MSKHYAAPWKMVVRDDGYAEINAKNDSHYAFAKVVVRMADPEDTADNDRLMANARLMVAAPELMETARMVDAWGNGLRHKTSHEAKMVKAARAALAKAEGRA